MVVLVQYVGDGWSLRLREASLMLSTTPINEEPAKLATAFSFSSSLLTEAVTRTPGFQVLVKEIRQGAVSPKEGQFGAEFFHHLFLQWLVFKFWSSSETPRATVGEVWLGNKHQHHLETY